MVTLRGRVFGTAEQWEAERIALRVAGVKGVVNHLEVTPGNVTATDTRE